VYHFVVINLNISSIHETFNIQVKNMSIISWHKITETLHYNELF